MHPGLLAESATNVSTEIFCAWLNHDAEKENRSYRWCIQAGEEFEKNLTFAPSGTRLAPHKSE
jgi:hypothetical protein